ncbi:hypothetical protein LRS13_18030 [Svornostia abyssi]|uniref:Lipoprotein n=1 Tax=Svornostia abyssi TaxID=2898438 RepID=A0ABY5PD59_9ACTN|nr:hypothetical protein LRS13_18030 [Parviterribacteraceae bacterium J379]
MFSRHSIPIVITALALSACGESAREKFVGDADAVCERVNREFGERIEDPDALVRMYPVVRKAQADLNAIEAPTEDKGQFARYVKVNQARIDLLAAALKDPVADVYSDPRMKRAEALQARSTKIARELGFEHCS